MPVLKSMCHHPIVTPVSVLRELRSSKKLQNIPDGILLLFVQFSSEECYHCRKLRCDESEEEQQMKWTRFYDGWVCSDCLVEQCICNQCEEMSDSAFGHTTYCDACTSPLCMECRPKCGWCVLALMDVDHPE